MEELRKAFEIDAKLKKCRDTARFLAQTTGEPYPQYLSTYTEIINVVMEKHKLKPIEAVLKISESDAYQQSGVAQLLFMAALAEILEPSDKPKLIE